MVEKSCETRQFPAPSQHLSVFLALESNALMTQIVRSDYERLLEKERGSTVLLRTHIGASLRSARTEQNRTLRNVAREARVSLGYLSEVERGQKEASSELLNAIASALGLTLSSIISNVAKEISAQEKVKLVVVDAA